MNLQQRNRKLSTRLAVVAVAMFGFGFALVPFYNQICAALGVGSLVERSEPPQNTQVDASRSVTVEFDANSRDLPWRFQPTVRHISVHPGEVATVEYEVVNVRAAPVTGIEQRPNFLRSLTLAAEQRVDLVVKNRRQAVFRIDASEQVGARHIDGLDRAGHQQLGNLEHAGLATSRLRRE